MYGRVNFFNDVRSYGFIKSDEGEKYFFHATRVVDHSEVSGTRLVGKRVQFDLAPAISLGKKHQAVNVRVAQNGMGLLGVPK
jgi:cold shock CspA family protein